MIYDGYLSRSSTGPMWVAIKCVALTDPKRAAVMRANLMATVRRDNGASHRARRQRRDERGRFA